MGDSCPVCDQPLPPGATRCPTCGFPAALMDADLGPFPSEADRDRSGADTAARPGTAPNATSSARSPEAQLNAVIGHSLAVRMEMLQPLVGDAPDVTSELCQAALNEASGRDSEALSILRSAQGRLERESVQMLERAVTRIDERRKALERVGLRVNLGAIPVPSQGIDPASVGDLLLRLREAEEHLRRFESDWKGVSDLLETIDSLRNEADTLGVPLADVPDRYASIRQMLSSTGVTEEELDMIVLEAARILMDLHEAIPSAVEEELGRHASTLGRFPESHPGADGARRAHGRASEHLNEGRLTEAMHGVREVRQLIQALEPIPPPSDQPPSAPAPPPPEPTAPTLSAKEEALLANLLNKARSLAARVRTLPAESPEATDAASRIREATDLLRARKLDEADLALTRLMRSLAYPESPA